jgi:hypothetical protein
VVSWWTPDEGGPRPSRDGYSRPFPVTGAPRPGVATTSPDRPLDVCLQREEQVMGAAQRFRPTGARPETAEAKTTKALIQDEYGKAKDVSRFEIGDRIRGSGAGCEPLVRRGAGGRDRTDDLPLTR